MKGRDIFSRITEKSPIRDREHLAYTEAKRVRSLNPAVRKKLLRLTVYCEEGRCVVLNVYALKLGRLLDGSIEYPFSRLGQSVAEILPAKGWGSRGKSIWLDDDNPSTGGGLLPKVDVTCECQHTDARSLNLDALRALLDTQPKRRRASITDFV